MNMNMGFMDTLKFWKPKYDPIADHRAHDFAAKQPNYPDQGMNTMNPMNQDHLGLGNNMNNDLGFQEDPYNQDSFQDFQNKSSGIPQGSQGFQQQRQRNPQQQQAQTYYREFDHTGLQQNQNQHSFPQNNRDIELIAAKLDAVRVSLDMVNQRLNVIEKELQNRHRGW